MHYASFLAPCEAQAEVIPGPVIMQYTGMNTLSMVITDPKQAVSL